MYVIIVMFFVLLISMYLTLLYEDRIRKKKRARTLREIRKIKKNLKVENLNYTTSLPENVVQFPKELLFSNLPDSIREIVIGTLRINNIEEKYDNLALKKASKSFESLSPEMKHNVRFLLNEIAYDYIANISNNIVVDIKTIKSNKLLE